MRIVLLTDLVPQHVERFAILARIERDIRNALLNESKPPLTVVVAGDEGALAATKAVSEWEAQK